MAFLIGGLCFPNHQQQGAALMQCSQSLFVITGILLLITGSVRAESCGDSPSGFAAWKSDFARYAEHQGVQAPGLKALQHAQYASSTIWADRNQKSFKYSLEKFMQIRGAQLIVQQGRKRQASAPEFYQALEQRYGVDAGVLIAIHGMETAFGHFMGESNIISAITTLAYDCRRPDFFTPHAVAALKLVDSGTLSSDSIGAKHGEYGHTQFLPGNVVKYGIDGNGDGVLDLTNLSDAMASTANFFMQKGWQRGEGYQINEPNYPVLQQWNAATVYQQAIAIMGKLIDQAP